MSTPHVHDWKPVPGEMARYSCACNASGYRARTGEIVEHRSKPVRPYFFTARPRDSKPRDKAEHGQWNAPSERDS